MKKLYKRLIIIAAVLVFFGSIVLAIVLPGKITTEISEGSLRVSCYYYGSKPVAQTLLSIDDYEVIFYENYFEDGVKMDGLSLAFIKSGRYENDQLGEYRLYRYKRNKSVIILKSEYSKIVIGLKTYAQTLVLYNNILAQKT